MRRARAFVVTSGLLLVACSTVYGAADPVDAGDADGAAPPPEDRTAPPATDAADVVLDGDGSSADAHCSMPTTQGCPCGVVCASRHCSNGGCDPLVFVTSTALSGNLGGTPASSLVNADAECTSLADAITRSPKTTFQSWLSIGPSSVKSRFVRSTRPYRLNDAASSIVSNGFASLASALSHPIDVDEKGAFVNATNVWTGSERDGAPAGEDCVGWTASSLASSGVFGRTDATNVSWTHDGSASCTNFFRLYCFEQLPG